MSQEFKAFHVFNKVPETATAGAYCTETVIRHFTEEKALAAFAAQYPNRTVTSVICYTR